MHVLTVVSAMIDPAEDGRLVSGFTELGRQPLPDGLLHTQLLRGSGGEWRIESRWRDRAALDAMRAAPGEPAAPALFRSVGGEPRLQIFDVAAEHVAGEGAQVSG